MARGEEEEEREVARGEEEDRGEVSAASPDMARGNLLAVRGL